MDSQERLTEAINRQTEALAKFVRPHVIADVYPRRSVNMLYFRIRNVGQTPAFNVRAQIDPPIPLRQRSSSDLNIFTRPIGVLGPREEISFFFDSAIEIFNRENPILQFDVRLEYADADRVVYQQSIHVDIELLKNLAVELPASDKMTEELEHIYKEVEKIARYTDQLRHQEMMKDWQESKKQTDQPTTEEQPSEN